MPQTTPTLPLFPFLLLLFLSLSPLTTSIPQVGPSFSQLSESFTLKPFTATNDPTTSQSTLSFTIAKGAYSAPSASPSGGSASCTATWPLGAAPPACWTVCSDAEFLFRVDGSSGDMQTMTVEVMRDCGEGNRRMGSVGVGVGMGGYTCGGGEEGGSCDVGGGQGFTAPYRLVEDGAEPRC